MVAGTQSVGKTVVIDLIWSDKCRNFNAICSAGIARLSRFKSAHVSIMTSGPCIEQSRKFCLVRTLSKEVLLADLVTGSLFDSESGQCRSSDMLTVMLTDSFKSKILSLESHHV